MISIICMALLQQLGTGTSCSILREKFHKAVSYHLALNFPKMLWLESVEYQTLRNGVKKVLGVVVGLLKDRACAEDDSPSKKKARIEEYRSKK